MAAADAAAEEKCRGKLSAACIAAVVVLIGLPLWWKTTETYRASLPYGHISELDLLLLDISVPVEVVFARGTLTAEQQKKLLPQTQFSHKRTQLDGKTGLKYRYEKTYRAVTGLEQDALMSKDVEGAVVTLSQVYESPAGSVVIYVVPTDSQLMPDEVSVYIGKHRASLLRSPVTGSHSVQDVLRDIDDSIEEILQTVSFTDDMVVAALSNRVPLGTFGADSFTATSTAFKSSLGYEITFSLLNPDPKSHDICWDIERAVNNYVQPFLDKLSFVANFSVDSQILYYAVLGVTPRFDKASSSFSLTEGSLSHVINPVEAKLGSNVASSYPVLNFLLYVPEYSHSPLYIHDSSGSPVESNAFHSPRWGGILIYNVDQQQVNKTLLPVSVKVDMARVMEVFLSQLRLLMGIQKVQPPPDTVIQSPGNMVVTDWETDRLLCVRTVENIATATNTLTSLAQLIDEIGNIVINDNIASEVYSAVASVQQSLEELEAGRLLPAFQASKEAITSSEKAFFDPSLLHLLYFPDDQKFAIYIPLFLPMCVPIVLSLAKAGMDRRWRRKVH
ncbi:GPI transamidase component PIG-S isoform X1 [Hypanus sabinus]|uniref:GPI transamidase component PIG-S isoform X1 n=1 Tax=Hypanus sabinus TaxID=79690 RepID=UPI0028C4F64D|nr:GPI transamidase component PIG-S isoform X1 [Hypanus sabinus]